MSGSTRVWVLARGPQANEVPEALRELAAEGFGDGLARAAHDPTPEPREAPEPGTELRGLAACAATNDLTRYTMAAERGNAELGVSELSMAPRLIPEVKQALRGVDLGRARAAAGRALEATSASEAREHGLKLLR